MSKLNRFSLVAFAAAIFALPVFTQDENAEERDVEEIIVTGSKLSRTNFDSDTPILTITGEEISNRLINTAGSAVAQLPNAALANSNLGDDYQSNSGVGQNIVSLFGLGSQRTLTLVNGRRFISSNSPQNGAAADGLQVDTNNIPILLLDRVEVSNVGGASVYGSDAVAGVVNYVLKDDFEGFRFQHDYNNIADISEDKSWKMLFGANFDDGRGNFALNIDYAETGHILLRELQDSGQYYRAGPYDVFGTDVQGQVQILTDYAVNGLDQGGQITNSAAGFFLPNYCARFGAAYCTGWSDGEVYGFGRDGSFVQKQQGAPTGNVVWADGGDGVRLLSTDPYLNPLERTNINLFVNYDVTDNIKARFEMYTNEMSAQEGAFQPFISNNLFGSPQLSIPMSADNPYLPADAKAFLAAEGAETFSFSKWWVDLYSPNNNKTDTDMFRFSLEGSFGDFDWEFGMSRGQSTILENQKNLNIARFALAIDAGINPATNEIDCKYNYEAGYDKGDVSELNVSLWSGSIFGAKGDCAPLNPFGFAQGSPEAYDYLMAQYYAKVKMSQEISYFEVNGVIAELPAGEVQALFGIESRTEKADYNSGFGAVTRLAYEAGNGGKASQGGQFDSDDVYLEALVPLVSMDMNIPFVQNLDLSISYREIDHSYAGSDSTEGFGLTWSIIDDLSFRAKSQSTVRAPNVGELFKPIIQGSSFTSDPCDANNLIEGPNPDVRAANCAAAGLPADFSSQAGNASVRGTSGGNLNLVNEEADTNSYGFVYTPTFNEVVDGLQIAVDFIEFDIQNAITTFTLTQVMEACYDATNFPNNSFCDSFNRLPSGQLPKNGAYSVGVVNAAYYLFDTYIYEVSYNKNLTELFGYAGIDVGYDLGEFGVSTIWYQKDKDIFSATGFDEDDELGGFNNPKNRVTTRFNWELGKFYSYLDLFYRGGGKLNDDWNDKEDPLRYLDRSGNPLKNDVDGYYTASAGLLYSLNDNVKLNLRVTNLFDRGPENDTELLMYPDAWPGTTISGGFQINF
jgi:outer membrane receptor protein involved in Fe transport